jgi:hypothetical protein
MTLFHINSEKNTEGFINTKYASSRSVILYDCFDGKYELWYST